MFQARAGAVTAAVDPLVRMNKDMRALPALAATAPTPAAFAQDALTRSAGENPSIRPDLGIEVGDVCLNGRALAVIVHGPGLAAAPGGTLFLEDSSGRTVASTKIAALAAPTDLMPKKARVRLMVPAGVAVETPRLRLALRDGGREVTMRNAMLPLAAVTRR